VVVRDEFTVERPTLRDWLLTREGWRQIRERVRRKLAGSRPQPHTLTIAIDPIRALSIGRDDADRGIRRV